MIDPRRATLLVPSCDRYADVWRPFFALLRRNWPDCPFRVVLGTNHRVCDEPGVETLRIGDDRDWTAGVRAMLDQTASDTVLVMLEDYLLRSRVDTGALLARLADHEALGAAYLRLRPFPPPDFRLARFDAVGEIAPQAPYRAALQAAFWRRDALDAMLVDGENPWEFEIYGSRRSDTQPRGFYATWAPHLDYYAGVTAGKWIPYAVAVCREQGVTVDLDARPMMDARQALTRNVGRAINEAVSAIPWQARERALRWFRATGLRRPPGRVTAPGVKPSGTKGGGA